jgi:hypothetical protein
VPAAVHGEDELHRAAVDAAVLDVVDGEAPAQQHAGVRTADLDGQEVAGPGQLRDAGRDDRDGLVRADLLDEQHLAATCSGIRRSAGRDCRGGRMRRWCSCSDSTPMSPRTSASMPCTQAAAPAPS